jgi:peptide-methionine (R)-S-oxide reductase
MALQNILMALLCGLTCLASSFMTTYHMRPPIKDDSSLGGTDCHVTRRRLLKEALATTFAVTTTFPETAFASSSKSRTEGYAVQHSEKEWVSLLSDSQYNILRRGGTERQKSSVLENEERAGTFVCAGCETPLFVSTEKFRSGTGWPSFAAAMDGAAVEVCDRTEVRCNTCGGHLGDVFNDGWRFVGTPASKTGKRFCINGAVLVFKPEGGGKALVGDRTPPNKVIQYESAMYREPRPAP